MKEPRVTFTLASLRKLRRATLHCMKCGKVTQYKGRTNLRFYAFIEPDISLNQKQSTKVRIVCENCGQRIRNEAKALITP